MAKPKQMEKIARQNQNKSPLPRQTAPVPVKREMQFLDRVLASVVATNQGSVIDREEVERRELRLMLQTALAHLLQQSSPTSSHNIYDYDQIESAWHRTLARSDSWSAQIQALSTAQLQQLIQLHLPVISRSQLFLRPLDPAVPAIRGYHDSYASFTGPALSPLPEYRGHKNISRSEDKIGTALHQSVGAIIDGLIPDAGNFAEFELNIKLPFPSIHA